jgi:hypothetical protein
MARIAESRLFTVEEANRMLPSVAQTLQDLRRLQRRIRNLDSRLTVLNLVCDRFISGSNPDLREFLTLKVRYHRKIGLFHDILRKLEMMGCYLQDLKQGVVHFLARRGDERVMLCWREGEHEVSHWHPIEDHEKPEDETPRHSIEAWDQF